MLRASTWASAFLCTIAITGCDRLADSPDSDAGHARIINDMPYAVDVMLCDQDDCGKPRGLSRILDNDRYHNQTTLQAGRDNPNDYFNVSKRGVPNVYLVRRHSTKRLIGCLPFVMPEDGPTLVAKVSEHVPCGRPINEHVRWPY